MPDVHDPELHLWRLLESQDDPRCVLDTGVGLPCPFCAAPAFSTYPVFLTKEDCHLPQTCAECGRTGKFMTELATIDGVSGTQFCVIMMGGPPLPDRSPIKWMH